MRKISIYNNIKYFFVYSLRLDAATFKGKKNPFERYVMAFQKCCTKHQSEKIIINM